MEFSHFTSAEAVAPYSVDQVRPHPKPVGLWVSVDGPNDWPTFCRDNDWGGCKPNRFRVTLTDGPLVLSTVTAIREFSSQYGMLNERSAQLDRYAYGWEPRVHRINWPAVAAEYPGVIIAPYQWSLRMADDVAWYYTWDCASGCIWDASVIVSVERVVMEVV